MTLPRPLVTLRLLLSLALVALAAPLFVSPAASTAVAADTGGSSKTVAGDWHRWIPNKKLVNDPDFGQYWEGAYDDSTPSVTVDRTTNLGDEVVNVSWKNFTPTSNNPAYADFDSGKPTTTPTRVDDSSSPQYYGVEIYQCRGDRPTIDPAENLNLSDPRKAECYESSVFTPFDGQYGQNNRVPAVTQNNGSGFAQFHVENALSNDLLGCSSSQACSIAVVPTSGGMWDQDDRTNKSLAGCDDHSADFPQPPDYSFLDNANVSSTSSPCNWARRIVVPLKFAPIAAGCPDSTASFNAAGSPPLRRALGQLAAGWCRDSQPVTFGYNFSSTEAEARNRFLAGSSGGLTSDVDVALTSQPVAASANARPFRYAPIANNAVSIPYLIDNPRTGRPITDLRLSARLVAKLLTQSYAPQAWNCKPVKTAWCESAISNNPTSPFDDPEFQKLNFRGDHASRSDFPSVGGANPTTGSQLDNGGFFPSVAAGDSDLTYALTRWIASDPGASAFLDGRADPWGMRINPNYRVAGQQLYPTSQFQAQDPGYTAPQTKPAPGVTPDVRYYQGMQGSWNPLAALSQVALTMVRNRSTASPAAGACYDASGFVGACPDVDILPIQFKRTPPEPNGARSLTGVTDLTDARAYGLSIAELVTQQGKTVEASTTSVSAAVSALTTNRDGVTGSLNFAKAPVDAYPLALPVYAMVPTCGLTQSKAAGIKRMLGKVVSSQTYGDTPGTLARGLVKLTSAQLADTRRAAALVSTKSCSPVRAAAGNGPRNSNGGNGSGANDGNGFDAASDSGGFGGNGSNGGGSNGGLGGGPQGPAASSNGSAASATPKPSSGSSSTPNANTKNVGFPIDDNGGGVSLLPIVLLVGALLLIGGPVGWWALATAPGRTFRDKARHLVVGTPWGRRG